MSEETKNPTIDELFSRAGLRPNGVKQQQYNQSADRLILRGRRRAYRFAQLLIAHNFSDLDAYRAYAVETNRPNCHDIGNAKRWARAYAYNHWVCRYVREMMQEAYQRVSQKASHDLEEMLAVNRLLVFGDICDLVEDRNAYTYDAEGKIIATRRVTQLKPLREMTRGERMMVHKIRFKDGEVIALEGYSRLEAMKLHVGMMELLRQSGGSDQDWMRDFRSRIERARQQRLDLEVAAGKVIRLPGRTA